ncbi:hypothetical protein GCM10007973_11210 [Polymorphobacter multimanifer]|nr:hypothetical protein GCM10007973_11210 [Polymorphobacter multimanifer]
MNKIALLALSTGFATMAVAQEAPPTTGSTAVPSAPAPAPPLGAPNAGMGNAPSASIPATPPQRPPLADRGLGSMPTAPAPAPAIGQTPAPGSVVENPRP